MATSRTVTSVFEGALKDEAGRVVAWPARGIYSLREDSAPGGRHKVRSMSGTFEATGRFEAIGRPGGRMVLSIDGVGDIAVLLDSAQAEVAIGAAGPTIRAEFVSAGPLWPQAIPADLHRLAALFRHLDPDLIGIVADFIEERGGMVDSIRAEAGSARRPDG